MKTLSLLTGLVAFAFSGFSLPAQTNAAPAPLVAMSSTDAITTAKDGVDISLRGKLVSVYGSGTPTQMQKWWVIYYDPTLDSHGRVVKVENNQITHTFASSTGAVYKDSLTFPPSQVSSEQAALATAQNYATKHNLTYDHAHALLHLSTPTETFRWRVELINGTTSKGYVFVNAADGTLAQYAPPESRSGKSGLAGDLERAGDTVKNTFLGIGGDLEEFFTGERTVDQ